MTMYIFPGNCCQNGFDAERGWDPVSGLGSPLIATILPQILDAGCNSTANWGCTRAGAQGAGMAYSTSAVGLLVALGVLLAAAIAAAMIHTTRTANARKDGYEPIDTPKDPNEVFGSGPEEPAYHSQVLCVHENRSCFYSCWRLLVFFFSHRAL